jgi:ERCC4-type nuclease
MDDSVWSNLSPSTNSGVCRSCNKTAVSDDSDDSNDSDGAETELSFEQLDAIGESGASNLRAAGFVTVSDVKNASDEDLLDVSWIGEKGVQSIRQKTETFK